MILYMMPLHSKTSVALARCCAHRERVFGRVDCCLDGDAVRVQRKRRPCVARHRDVFTMSIPSVRLIDCTPATHSICCLGAEMQDRCCKVLERVGGDNAPRVPFHRCSVWSMAAISLAAMAAPGDPSAGLRRRRNTRPRLMRCGLARRYSYAGVGVQLVA
jgi:hypothetical protein